MLVSGSVPRHCRTDEELLAKLSVGDLVALEAKYHAHCLASLYKKAERVKGKKAKKMGQLLDDRRIWRFVEMISFIEKSRMVNTAMLPVFRLVELVGKYTSCLKQLGENTPARIHTTHLKDRILFQISALEEHKQGRDVFFLAFKNDLANVLRSARKEDSAEEDAPCQSRKHSAQKTQKYKFDRSFEANC